MRKGYSHSNCSLLKHTLQGLQKRLTCRLSVWNHKLCVVSHCVRRVGMFVVVANDVQPKPRNWYCANSQHLKSSPTLACAELFKTVRIVFSWSFCSWVQLVLPIMTDCGRCWDTGCTDVERDFKGLWCWTSSWTLEPFAIVEDQWWYRAGQFSKMQFVDVKCSDSHELNAGWFRV